MSQSKPGSQNIPDASCPPYWPRMARHTREKIPRRRDAPRTAPPLRQADPNALTARLPIAHLLASGNAFRVMEPLDWACATGTLTHSASIIKRRTEERREG